MRPLVYLSEVVSLVYPGLPRLHELIDRHVDTPVVLLDQEGADQEPGSLRDYCVHSSNNIYL